jgi:hypothetical protein
MTMRSEVKKTLLALAFICVAFLVFDRMAGEVCHQVLRRLPESQDELARLKHCMYDVNSDCVVLGSSRACHQIDSRILADSLGMSVYNGGREGCRSVYASALYHAIVSRYTPKMIILDVDYLETQGEWKDRISLLRPFYRQFPQSYSLSRRVLGLEEGVKSFFWSYRYNSTVLDMAKDFSAPADTLYGYLPLEYNERTMPREIVQLRNNLPPVDTVCENILTEMVKDCQRRGIFLVAVYPPKYVHYGIPTPMTSYFARLGVPFLNYYGVPEYYQHPEWFMDDSHLDRVGASVFTGELAHDVIRVSAERSECSVPR